MLNRIVSLSLLVVSIVLASCGGSSNTITGPGGGGGGAEVASVQVLAAATTLDSDLSGLNTVDITAIVRDANNVVLEGVPVSFGANANGSISVIQLNTDTNGQALARLSNGTDPSNRAITVTATAGESTGSVTVNVIKTEVTIDCPDSAVLGGTVNCAISLKDSKAAGIPGQAVTVTSSLGNTLSAASVTTNGSGQAGVTLTAVNSGSDILTATALGDAGTDTVTIPAVSGDNFSITTPAADGLEIPLNTNQAVTVTWSVSGAPQNGQTMQFAASRGSFFQPGTQNPAVPPQAVTAGAGTATLDIRSSTAGTSTIAVSRPGGGVATRTVEFVATVAASIDVQAEPSSVRTGNQSQITAIVRDGAGNLVKNKLVTFSLTDNTGGSLSSPVATTGSDGRATIVYTAGTSQSSVNGVTITASVEEGGTISDAVALTVTGQALAISLGTGNDLFELGTATFAKEWVIFVTDADGNAVSGKTVTVSIRSVNFKKGNMWLGEDGQDDAWSKQPYDAFEPLSCPDEDINFNGILDPGEDGNTSGLLEAGNIALVAPVAANAPAGAPCSNLAATPSNQTPIVTGNDGRARVCVVYPQNYNWWLDARIQARATVQGTEFSKSTTFELEALADDINDTDVSPPGVVSPFGTVDTSLGAPTACAQPPPP